VVALARVGRGLHLAQQGVHLRAPFSRRPARTAAVAGHGGADLFQPLLQGQGLAVLGQVVGDVADQAGGVGLAQQGRGLADQHGAGAEALDDQAQGRQFVGAGDDALGLGGVQLDHLGQQQGLAGDAAGGHLALHALVDQALVGGVLVDDDHAVAGLGDDVGLVHLGPGRAQREVDGIEHRGGAFADAARIGDIRRGVVLAVGRLAHGLGDAAPEGVGSRLGLLRRGS
jgi:hypothetical protein